MGQGEGQSPDPNATEGQGEGEGQGRSPRQLASGRGTSGGGGAMNNGGDDRNEGLPTGPLGSPLFFDDSSEERRPGPITGEDYEQWADRLDCRQWGAPFPHVAGLAGPSGVGAQSVALSGGLRFGERLAGLLALSTYLPYPETLAAGKSSANLGVPILMCHGRMDPVVPVSMGLEARDVLTAQGYAVEWHEYPMQHEVCAAELGEIARWLQARLAP
jgi:pimeloyl-ACP methyl ester carboxylesterase